MNRHWPDELESCLPALFSGQDPASILADHPGSDAALQPALLAAQALLALQQSEVPAAARARSRARTLAALQRPGERRVLSPAYRFAGVLIAVLLGLVVTGGALEAASAQALPGDTLYPVKLAGEQIRVRLTLNSRSRVDLEERQVMRRADEVRRLIAMNRVASVSFPGLVQDTALDLWHVDGVPVLVTTDTYVTPGILPGMGVEVHGETRPQGFLLAEEIHLTSFELSGRLTTIGPESWTIGGVEVRVLTTTEIEPWLQVGDQAVALVHLHDTGPLTARSIREISPPPALLETPTPASVGGAPTDDHESDDHSGSSPGGEENEPSEDEDDADGEEGDDGDGGSGSSGGSGGQDDESDGGEEEDEELEEVSLEGTVQSQAGLVWVIDGETIRIDGSTEIDGDPQVGDTVKVEGVRLADGSVLAEKIEKED
jgi:hypothetical protein